MVSIKDKFLSAHRSQVKGCFGGFLNVFYTLVVFNALDYVILGYFWYLYHVSVNNLDCRAFLNEMIVNTILTVSPIISLIKSNVLFYISFVFYFLRLWHICHMAGKAAGLLIFHSIRVSKSFQFNLYTWYTERLRIYGNSIIVCIIRIIFILLALWFSLVLQKIRFVGGTGFEKKCAEEFELEALNEFLKDKDQSYAMELERSKEITLDNNNVV